MKLLFFCSNWGLEHLGLETMLKKIRDAGFDGVEMGVPLHAKGQQQLNDLLHKYNLYLIAHQYQAAGDFEIYYQSFRRVLKTATGFAPLFVSSKTGRSYWSFEQNSRLIDLASEIESLSGIEIFHETHRKHFLCSAKSSMEYFSHFPGLCITADLSHWVCASESLLQDQPETIEKTIERTEHIHARIGYEEGPQVPDPRAPEWGMYLDTFVKWWQKIVDRHKAEERDYLTITPEAGPSPYTWNLPFTREPVSDFFEINRWMKDYLKKHLKV